MTSPEDGKLGSLEAFRAEVRNVCLPGSQASQLLGFSLH
jgi:hypothetical protein